MVTNCADMAVISRRSTFAYAPYVITARLVRLHNRPDERPSMCLKDDSGSFVILSLHNHTKGLQLGDLVRATGTILHYANGQTITSTHTVDRLAHGTADEPIRVTAAQFLSGSCDFSPVRLVGTVCDAFRDEIDPRFIFVVLLVNGTRLYAVFRTASADESVPTPRLGETVELTGLCTPMSATNRKRMGRHLAADAFKVVDPVPSDPFAVPEIGNLSFLSPYEIAGLGRRRTRGRVRAVVGGSSVLAETADGDWVEAELANPPLPAVGDDVELSGYPDSDTYNVNLTQAAWRPCDRLKLKDVAATNVTAQYLLTDGAGHSKIKPGFHGRPVVLEGLVRSLPDDVGDRRLIHLQCGEHLIPVDVHACANLPAGLVIGATVSVRGICLMNIDKWRANAMLPRIRGITLAVSSPADITILKRPSWWTPARFLVVIGILVLGMLFVLLWNFALRKLANRRGYELMRMEIGRVKSSLKTMERTRLAIELHDSISQSLTGVNFEVNTASRLSETDLPGLRHHLDIASKTLVSCRAELRNCLWDLRNDAMEERLMTDAVMRTLKPHLGGAKLAVRFNVTRSHFSDTQAHALLRIVRELTVNAIRHGHATEIRVAGSLDAGVVKVSVTDNGGGFDPANAPGCDDGHFGLQGIRERLADLNGAITIESTPGAGVRAVFTFPLDESAPEP